MSDDGRLSFPDRPRAELDDALVTLIAHAERVKSAQGRLRSLLHAVQAVAGEIELPALLRRVVQSAIDLVDAEYGALGVIAADRATLDQFITVGLDEEHARAIGALPRGRGLLGALIADPHVIRLEKLGQDPRATGFPPHHPEMESFLGAPVRVGGEVFGNLYLTNSRHGRFSAEDEQLVQALASTAGIAIRNARLLEEARLRATWMAASAALSAGLLSTPPNQALDLLAGRVIDLSAAERVTVTVPVDGTSDLRVEAVRGSGEERLAGLTVATTSTVAGAAIAQGPVRHPGGSSLRADDPALAYVGDTVGPAASVPLRTRRHVWGVLTVARAPGQREFSAVELEVLGDLGSQASIALELAAARIEQQRAILTDERARIARDLHDHVIQQLFSAGLTLQTLRTPAVGSDHGERLGEVIEMLDDAIKQIRTVIFAISSRDGDSLRHRLIDVVAETSAALRRPPALRFSGPLDTSLREALADDVVAAARELLSNSVRHANADVLSLDVRVADGEVLVIASDGGVGIADGRRSGLQYLSERAESHGGSLDIETGSSGTRAVWRASLAERGAGKDTS